MFNQATTYPRDGSGRKFNEFFAEWLAKNLNRFEDMGYGKVYDDVLFDITWY